MGGIATDARPHRASPGFGPSAESRRQVCRRQPAGINSLLEAVVFGARVASDIQGLFPMTALGISCAITHRRIARR
jgi:hypothetical protein